MTITEIEIKKRLINVRPQNGYYEVPVFDNGPRDLLDSSKPLKCRNELYKIIHLRGELGEQYFGVKVEDVDLFLSALGVTTSFEIDSARSEGRRAGCEYVRSLPWWRRLFKKW